MSLEYDVAIIGGGPAGTAAARVLASHGHRTVLLTRADGRSPGRAESLPPSTRRVLARIGVLDTIDAAGFCRTSGNSVWWGERDGDVELFGETDHDVGYQVLRPQLDALLRNEAAAVGAEVREHTLVRRVAIDDDRVRLECVREGEDAAGLTVLARVVLDASGRAGVVAQRWRRPQPGFSSQAFIGAWTSRHGWHLPNPTHTVVETYDDGWAYSVPMSATCRHIGVIVDSVRSSVSPEPDTRRKYQAEIAKTVVMAGLANQAALDCAWACAASMYDATEYASGRCLLVGDAGSFLEPLSSFGVKKALVSGWMGAVTAHTVLEHPVRTLEALAFFSSWEERVYHSSLRRSCQFAREAHASHPSPFWSARAAIDMPSHGVTDERALLREPDVLGAFERIKSIEPVCFERVPGVPVGRVPFIRGDEIVVEEGVTIQGVAAPVRFLAGVDLVALRDLACAAGQLPTLLDAYQRRHGEVPLPGVLAGLSLLVARGILALR